MQSVESMIWNNLVTFHDLVCDMKTGARSLPWRKKEGLAFHSKSWHCCGNRHCYILSPNHLITFPLKVAITFSGNTRGQRLAVTDAKSAIHMLPALAPGRRADAKLKTSTQRQHLFLLPHYRRFLWTSLEGPPLRQDYRNRVSLT
jgi:hypothetical protein